MEAAYKRMLFKEAGNMLYFKNQEELVEFAKEVTKIYLFFKSGIQMDDLKFELFS